MFIDKELVFSDAQAITSADAVSTNVVDLGAAGDANDALWFIARVDTEFDSSGDASTLEVRLDTCATENMSSPTVLFSTGALAQTALTAGAELCKVKVPAGCLQYLSAYYNESAAFTAGKIDAFLVRDVDTNS